MTSNDVLYSYTLNLGTYNTEELDAVPQRKILPKKVRPKIFARHKEVDK